MIDQIKLLSKQYLKDIIAIRREFHKYPELAFEEYDTAQRIANFLKAHHISFTEKVAKTGIVGLIEGKNPNKKVIALRADMDALPITEATEIAFKSLNIGKMHACGHDVHMASLLGTLVVLNKLKDKFEGTVKFLFQPSEEQYPGGASVMIAEGVLENPAPNCIFGQHVFPELKVGQVGFRSGKYMASTDEVFITVKGKGGHAALPSTIIDPVLIASHIVVAMQQIVSRFASPTMPTVISFGKIMGNGKTNVIPDKVELEGIIRTFDEDWRAEIKLKISKMAKSIAEAMGGVCEVRIDKGYPFVYNNPEITERAKASAIEFLGKDQVFDLDMRMTAEDFSFYTQKIPGTFYRLGVASPDATDTLNLHSALFKADENSLETGIGLMTWLTLEELKIT